MFPLFYLANRLGSDGAKYIADVLKMNTTLESLDIGCESFFCLFGRFFGKSKFIFIFTNFQIIYFLKDRTRLQLLSTATIVSILNFLLTNDQYSNLSMISSMT